LSIRIDELENKRQFKCTWVSCKLKEEVSITQTQHSTVLVTQTQHGTVLDFGSATDLTLILI